MYRAMGCVHATIHHELQKAHRALAAGEEGQGTVEYIGLILLIAGIMVAVVAAKGDNGGKELGKLVVDKLKASIGSVGGK
jgi:hypothetical protein